MMPLYEVTGPVPYRKHPPGGWFEAELDQEQERRAIVRGHLRVIDRRQAGLREGSWTLPAGWKATRQDEAPIRGLSHERTDLNG